jgi:hypothetical protein
MHELIGIGVLAATCCRDAVIESVQERGPLLVFEAVIETYLGRDRLQVHDLALGKVRRLVEHETAVVDVSLEWLLHHPQSLPGAFSVCHTE